jgi:hypothetical protein
MARMQNVAKIDKFCGFEKLAIPVLNAVKWIVGMGVEKTCMTAGRGSKTVLTTVQQATIFAELTKGIAQGLALKQNCKILITKCKPGCQWVITNLTRFRFH